MPIIEYKAQLDFTDNGVFETGWRIKQGDYGSCKLVFFVTNNGENQFDVGITPQIGFRRADGMSIVSELTPEDPFYTYTFVGNELEIPGPTLVDVKYVYVDGRISTATCRFDVVPDTIGYDPTGAGTYNNPVSALAEMALSTAQQAEAWAVGTKNGSPVSSGDPTYHNNSKYWSELRMGSKIKNTTGRFYTTTGGMLDSCVVALSPKQSGSGTPSTSNVRPITGHTSGEIVNEGKNKLNIKNERGKGTNAIVVFTDTGLNLSSTVSSTWNAYSAYLTNLLPNTTYKVSCDVTVKSGASTITIGSGSTTILTISNPSGHIERTFTTPSETDAMFIGLFSSNATSSTGNVEYANLMVCLESVTDTSYEPYNEQDITIQFGGTYYGGTFDFVSGVLTVTHKYIKLTSSNQLSGFATSAQYGAYAYINGTTDCLATDGSKVYGLCSMCEYVAFDNRLTTANVNRVWSDKNNTKLFIRANSASNVSTVTELYNIFANAEICYELATPQIIQLSPSQINSLVGQNNLSAPLEGQLFASAEYRDNMSAVYITDERVVGKWINGKDIYQRTIDLGSNGVSVPANSSASTGLAKGNVELPIWSTAISPSGQAFPHVGCSVGSTYIMMENKTNNATSVRYFTFQYTKQ